MQEKEKNTEKTDKNSIFDNRTIEISSDTPGNHPKCVLWPRYQFGLEFRI